MYVIFIIMRRISKIKDIHTLAIYDTVIRQHSKILIKDWDLADDLVNEMYLKLHKYLNKYPDKEIDGGFVSVTLRNLYRNHLKKITNKMNLGNATQEAIIPDSPIDDTDILEKVETDRLFDILDGRIADLTDFQQELLKDSLYNSILKISRQRNTNYHKLLKEYHIIINKLKQY